MQISWTLFSIISGMLYFEEYKGFTAQGGCLFAAAVMVRVTLLLFFVCDAPDEFRGQCVEHMYVYLNLKHSSIQD